MIPSIIRQDVDEVIANNQDLFAKFDDKTILITGATGMIGSFLIYALAEYYSKTDGNSRIIANARNRSKAEQLFSDYKDNDHFDLLICDLNDISVSDDLDYIIHAASPTQPQDFLQRPVDIIDTNTTTVRHLLNLAKEKQAQFCLLSTLEIYGEVRSDSYPVEVAEKDFGALDSTDLRSAYPESKRLAENMCVAYSAQFHTSSTIVRLGPVISPAIDEQDARVYAQFVKNVFNNQDLTLYSDAADKKRSYTYIADAIAGVLVAIENSLKGETTVFNLANNDNIISIQEMAEKIVAQNSSNAKLNITPRQNSSNTSSSTGKIILDSEKLISAGWKPLYSFDEAVENTFKYLQDK